MPILTIVIVLIVVGLILYLINNFIPMDSKIKSILNIVVVIVVIIWLLKAFGLLDSLKGFKI
ncbi:MAG: Thivi_2564 family membrane protein [Chitinophagaceae bacterium]